MESNFRLIRHVNEGEDITWSIHKVYYDSDNNPVMYDASPIQKGEINEQEFSEMAKKPWLKETNGELFCILK